ncbi:MAG TPA: ATP-binding cassette domain-containing protein [Steroidobacteraceae bacterium]|nr:ATP-binding cassette domain-containing protein [Steroidobacteraceae bacterium]
MIETRLLRKRFGAVVAVDGVSFVARDGEITGLLGPNGAGKSTCLRMIYGVLAPDGGEARIDGIDIRGETSAARACLGVLPHAAGLYGNLSARENVAYFGALLGIARGRLRTRIDDLAVRLEMGDFLDRRAKKLSQGQRVKVALARALVHEPRNLLLDEPTNGLDVMAIRGLRSLLRELRDDGKCILFSSHVMQEVAALCDRVVIIGQGRVRADDTPAALRERSGASSLEEAFVSLQATDEGLR